MRAIALDGVPEVTPAKAQCAGCQAELPSADRQVCDACLAKLTQRVAPPTNHANAYTTSIPVYYMPVQVAEAFGALATSAEQATLSMESFAHAVSALPIECPVYRPSGAGTCRCGRPFCEHTAEAGLLRINRHAGKH